LEKQGITGKNITATAIPWAVVKTYQEQIKANPKDIFTIMKEEKLLLCWTLGDIGIQPIRNGGVI